MILKHHHRFHYTALSTSFWPCHVSWFYYRQPLPVLGPWCFSASLCGWGSGSYRHTSSWFTPVTPSGPARPLPLPRRWPSPTAMKSPGSARSWVRSGEHSVQHLFQSSQKFVPLWLLKQVKTSCTWGSCEIDFPIMKF